MSLFERFRETKEEGFREQFVKPLLVRLGFYQISNKHGSQEFGKDYVFSELDRFGQFIHRIVQAKHLEKINQGNAVDDLITQVRQAFSVPYTLPIAPTEKRHVSAVYVFNTGKITDNAETQIRHSLRELASNVRFFSGELLENLANRAQQQQDHYVRERLMALDYQLEGNIIHWIKIHRELGNPDWKWDGGPAMLHAIEEYLTHPLVVNNTVIANELDYLWRLAHSIDHFLRIDSSDYARSRCHEACVQAEQTRKEIKAVLQSFFVQVV